MKTSTAQRLASLCLAAVVSASLLTAIDTLATSPSPAAASYSAGAPAARG